MPAEMLRDVDSIGSVINPRQRHNNNTTVRKVIVKILASSSKLQGICEAQSIRLLEKH